MKVRNIIQPEANGEIEMTKFLVVIEKANGNYSAYSPDLPGCIATGHSVDETKENMKIAMEMHLQGLVEDHLPFPQPNALAEYVGVNV
jgi:predicted RNase H-like HicB family nuclease